MIKQPLTFPKSARLLKSAQFRTMRRDHSYFVGSVILVQYRHTPSPAPKLGITVTKKFGNSPKRNHFKRLVREAFRLNQHELPPGIQVHVLPRKGAGDFSLASVASDLVNSVSNERAQSPATCSR